jgi:N4-gp56 family major capsid protein
MPGSSGSFATQVSSSSDLAAKIYSAALFAQIQKQPSFTNSLIGPAPKEGSALEKLRGQTSPDMPIVRITDLVGHFGDKVTVDIFGTVGGKPIVGDADAEGTGAALSSATQEIRIDLATKVVDAGGKMSQKRTKHQLRNIAKANLVSYFSRLDDQTALVHMAGARGAQNTADWVVPLDSDPDFGDILINPVQAPTYNSHFIADGDSLVKPSAANLSAVATTDILKLEHIDGLRTIMNEMAFPIQPIRIADDPAATDQPMWVLYVSPLAWSALLTNTSPTGIRAFQQNAWNRASYGSKHPLFRGEVGMWNGILVRQLTRAVRFLPSDTLKYVAAADVATAAETSGTVPALGAGYAIDRAILLGGQALGHAYGKNGNNSGPFNWLEKPYNFGRALEVAGDVMGGKAKVRFNLDGEVRDHGVMVLDTAVKLVL